MDQCILLVGVQRVHSGLEESKIIWIKERPLHHDDNGDLDYLESLAQRATKLRFLRPQGYCLAATDHFQSTAVTAQDEEIQPTHPPEAVGDLPSYDTQMNGG